MRTIYVRIMYCSYGNGLPFPPSPEALRGLILDVSDFVTAPRIQSVTDWMNDPRVVRTINSLNSPSLGAGFNGPIELFTWGFTTTERSALDYFIINYYDLIRGLSSLVNSLMYNRDTINTIGLTTLEARAIMYLMHDNGVAQ